ncbi:MAG TPA: hypothetical protein VLB07_06625 [Woeseiaceae bacterium]|nr:hypothetical protein [Woeseiaceae bacterium]
MFIAGLVAGRGNAAKDGKFYRDDWAQGMEPSRRNRGTGGLEFGDGDPNSIQRSW